MNRRFTSFDDAWRFFLNRQDEMESFFDDLPEQPSYLLAWLLRLDDEACASAVEAAQRAFSHLAWITPQPRHFLHTSIAAVSVAPRPPSQGEIDVAIQRAQQAWTSIGSFAVRYRRINCFHSAVVVEVEGDGPRTLAAAAGAPTETFLAHLTIGSVHEPHDATALRDALIPLREADIGGERITQASLCVIPASRSTVLDPWEIVGSVAFH
jgi:hypothetical protein